MASNSTATQSLVRPNAVAWILARQRATLLVSGALFLVTGALFVVIPKGFLSSDDTGQFIGYTEGLPGVSFAQMSRHQAEVATLIRKHPGVRGVSSTVGASLEVLPQRPERSGQSAGDEYGGDAGGQCPAELLDGRAVVAVEDVVGDGEARHLGAAGEIAPGEAGDGADGVGDDEEATAAGETASVGGAEAREIAVNSTEGLLAEAFNGPDSEVNG